ncbi:ferredoxin [Pacificispira sp.]|uniref:ferredoxin n=1 Tax=Pacificispira sp. TaxID=2888761 RepID=UPI003BAB7803
MTYDGIATDLAAVGLAARGGFHPGPADAAPTTCRSVILIGNVGPDFWPHFEAGRRDEPNALDSWTKRQVDRIAAKAGGWAVYPSDGPPYFPFQRWAMKAEPVHPSPIGMLIHPDFGLWHAYRAAICLHDAVPLPARDERPSPCTACADKPCLTTCPVGAFTGQGYDVPACAAHLLTEDGRDCVEQGCRARRACPVAGPDLYAAGQAAFHMRAFVAARD